MRLEIVAALRPLVHGNARRLVDHQDQAVAIKKPGLQFFLCHAGHHIPVLKSYVLKSR